MAAAAAASPAPPRIPLLLSGALLLLLAALLHSASSAAPEKEVPNRRLRARVRSSPDRSPDRWRLPYPPGSRSPRRYPGYLLGYGESTRKMSYMPLPKERKHDLKKIEEDELEVAKDLTVRVISSQSVLVTWTDPMHEKPKKVAASSQYTVRYREKGESARWDYKQVPNKRVLVDKLIPDTMYEFGVRISQGKRESKWSVSVYQRTPEAAPSIAPENLNVLLIKGKATSVTATWDALSESEGKVKEYILSYAPALKPFGAKSVTYQGDTTSAIVDDLQPGERYIFKIRAANRRGQGPQSKAFSVVVPPTSTSKSKVNQQTYIKEELAPRTSGNTAPSSPSQNLSPSSSTKHTLSHSSSFSVDRDAKSPVSDFNKLLAGSSTSKQPQLSSRKGANMETGSRSTEDTGDPNSSNEAPSIQAKAQDKSSVRLHSSVKPSSSVLSSGRTPLKSRTSGRARQTSTDEQRSSPSSSSPHISVSPSAPSSSPKQPESETKNLRQTSSNLPSSPKVTLANPPVDNESDDQIENVEEKPAMFSKTPEDTQLRLRSDRQPSASRKVVQSHPTQLLTPSLATKSSAAAVNSQSRPHHSSYKPAPSVTSDTLDTYTNRESEGKGQKPSSKPSSVKTKPLSHSSRHALRDPRVTTSAVSAAATHTLPQSHVSSSAKHKPHGMDESEDNDSEHGEKEDEKDRQGLRSRFGTRPLLRQPVSERFNLFKYRSALTTNRFANRVNNIHDTKIQPSKAPSSTTSSSHLSSDIVHRSNSNIGKDKALEDEDENPLPSTPLKKGHSSPFSRQSFSVDSSRRRSSLAEFWNRHRVAPTNKSNLANTQEENYNQERKDSAMKTDSTLKIQHADSLSSVSVQSPSLSKTSHHSSSGVSHQLTNGQSLRSRGSSTESLSRPSVEKSLPLRSSVPKFQPDDQGNKDMSPEINKTSSPKKKILGSSHALSRTTLHPEPKRSQNTKDPLQHRPSLHSRTHLPITPLQSNEKPELEEDEHFERNYDKKASDKEQQRGPHSVPAKDVSTSKRTSTSLAHGSTSSSLSRHSDSQRSKSDEIPPSNHNLLSSSKGLSLAPEKHSESKGITSSEDTIDAHKLPASTHQSKYVQPGSTSVRDTVKSHQYGKETTSLRQTHPSVPRYHLGSRVPTRTTSQTDKKYGLFQPTPTKPPSPKMRTSLSSNSDDYDESESVSSSAARWPTSSISRGSKSLKNNVASEKTKSTSSVVNHKVSPTHSSSSPSASPNQRVQNSRLLNPSQRQQVRLPHRQGNGGKPNLMTKPDLNNKVSPGNNGKPNGQKIINGPEGIKWIVDFDREILLNVEGRYLQDSQGKPLRVKLGGDGRTIVDSKGAPIVSPDGLPLFGHGRFSKPVASAQDKPIVSLGGKPLIGLEMIKKTTTPSTTTTTAATTTTTTTTTATTTTTTTPEPTTTEPPTEKPFPTCPPGTYASYDDKGDFVLGLNGLPDCISEDTFSGLSEDVTATTESSVIYKEDFEFFETTLPSSTTARTTTMETLPESDFPEFSVVGSDPQSEYDDAGKKRFTAPYVTYLNKDPAAPCSLTEALDHFQVESLDEIIPNDLKNMEKRPQKAPHNITIVAVEGCHSFVIVDWAKSVPGELVTGYLVYSASYDDFIRNKWSAKTAGSTHLPIENLKPNTRYYFKVQAKNPYGYGPISSSVSFVTESDDPLLIVRPPGGEPIWIPFNFKYDPTYSECNGKQYVKRTWYRKFVGVVLCNSLRYKIYLSDDLRDMFYSIGDSWGRGEDHCQFVDSHLDGRTGPQSYVEALPSIQGYYRQYRQEPVSFGRIGYMTPYYYVGWYECGVPIPGNW